MTIQATEREDELVLKSEAPDFCFATAAEDAELRTLLRNTSVGERVKLSLTREPQIFGTTRSVDERIIIARSRRTQELLGCISYLPQTLALGGASVLAGYLSQVRIQHRALNGYQRVALIRGGWRFLAEYLGAGVLFNYCSVTTARVERFVRSMRLPSSRIWADVPMRSDLIDVTRVRLPNTKNIRVESVSNVTLSTVLDYFAAHARNHDLFPVLSEPEVKKYGVRNIYIATRQGRIVGATVYANQMSERQIIVRGYSGTLRRCRPIINIGSFFGVLPLLPQLYQPIRLSFASHLATDECDLEVFDALLRTLAYRARSEGLSFLAIGLRVGHPLERQLRRFRSHCFESTVLLLNSRGHNLPGTLCSPAPEVSIL